MRMMQQLREFLVPYAQTYPRDESLCTCGDANHVRILTYRAAGRPLTLIVPEAVRPTLQQVGAALGDPRVEALSEEDFDSICEETDLGRQPHFANPFGTAVYIDESLILYPTLVFCPRMFGGREGECFRVPTRGFLEGTQASPLALNTESCVSDDWAV